MLSDYRLIFVPDYAGVAASEVFPLDFFMVPHASIEELEVCAGTNGASKALWWH